MNFTTCPACQGKKVKCEICQGTGRVLEINGHLFSWQTPFSKGLIYQQKFFAGITGFIRGLLYFFTTAGLILSLIFFWENISHGLNLFEILGQKKIGASIFYFDILLYLYIFYQLESWQPSCQRLESQKLAEKPAFGSQKVKKIEDYFTFESLKVINRAYLLALDLKQNLTVRHILWSLSQEEKIIRVLDRLDIDPLTLKEKLVKSKSANRLAIDGSNPSNECFLVLNSAFALAVSLNEPAVTLKNILMVLTSFKNPAEEILFDLGATAQKIKNTFEWLALQERVMKYWQQLRGRAGLKPKGPVNRAYTSVATPALDQFSDDLTNLARLGAIEPNLGSEKIATDLFEALASGKNAVLLIGEAGTGKTATLDYLAELMASELVPDFFKDKRLISISAGKLVAGANQLGEIEKRFFQILREVRMAGNIILFLDRPEDLVGLTTKAAGSLDLAGILANEIEKNYFVLIAATTPEAASKYLENSPLNLVMTRLEISEMGEDDSIRALGVKGLLLEKKFNLFFTYSAIEAAVKLSAKFLHHKCLPGKAVDVLERTAEYVKARANSGEQPKVLVNHIEEVVAAWSKVPVTTVTLDESEQLLHLEEKIHESVVDQAEAVSVVAEALRRARAELTSGKRPIACFLFLGPTGVGKTEVARTLANVYFGGEKNIIRLDMTEYSSYDALPKIIGEAGDKESGYLIQEIKEKPASLILLDEFEKASSQVQHLFLQVMEDGRLTDNQGQTHDFTNTIIIGTSNVASEFIQKAISENIPLALMKDKLIEEELVRYLKPELLNRFDAIVIFKPLTLIEVQEIARLMLTKLAAKLKEKGFDFVYGEDVLNELARFGFDPKFGARPLRRLIQDKVENKIAETILKGEVKRRDTLVLESLDVLKVKKAEEL